MANTRSARRVFEDLTGPRIHLKWNLWSPGDYFVGKFKQKTLNYRYDKDGSPVFHFEVEECSFAGSKARNIRTGDVLCVNSAGLLNKTMETIRKGQVMRIEYLGKEPMKNGNFAGTDAVSLKISVAREATEEELNESLELDTVPAGPIGAPSADDDASDIEL